MPSDNKREEPAVVPAPAIALSPEQLQALIAAMKGSGGPGGMDAEQFVAALQKANKPENAVSPGISNFNPKGERDYPKPPLKVKMTCSGYPLESPTLSVEEVTLLNQAKPGRYMVSKADGGKIPFDVLPRFNTLGTLDQLDLLFPCKTNDQRMGLLGLTSMLREIVTGLPESVRIEDLIAENLALRQQLVPAGSMG